MTTKIDSDTPRTDAIFRYSPPWGATTAGNYNRIRDAMLALERELAEANRALAEATGRVDAVVDGQKALMAQTVRIRRVALGLSDPREPFPASSDGKDTEEIVRDLRSSVEALVEALQWAAAFIECSKEPLPSPKLTSKIDAALSQAQENTK